LLQILGGGNKVVDEVETYHHHTEDRFSAPVPRELVHRRSISEVFVTGVCRKDNSTYTASAQWPRWHVFFGSGDHGFDSALVVETLRQVTVLIAHTQLHVPLGMQFLMSDMSVAMIPGAIRDPSLPAEVTVEVVISQVRARGHVAAGFRSNAVFLVGGQIIADGSAGARIVDPETYNRIRPRLINQSIRKTTVRPLPAAAVGHQAAWNVVLGQGLKMSNWPLHVDVSNPILFDHPLDHVPGVLMIEAVRQAMRVALGNPSLDFSFVDAQFVSIAELDDDLVVVLESVTVAEQAVSATATIEAAGKVRMRAKAGVTRLQQSSTDPSPTLRRRSAGTANVGPRENLHA
jgi:hypothetical protein